VTGRRYAAVIAALSVCLLLAAPPASAKIRTLDSYCSPSGDYCTAVQRRDGRVNLLIRTFSFRGRYRLCVRPPGGRRECRSFKLVATRHGIFASRIDLSRNFSLRARGRYAVSWRKGRTKLGPTLHFRKR
jgi:hypothetical protein